MPESITPLVIAVAPNGARYNKDDHPKLPITPADLAKTAKDCLDAGARMIHLHVRDGNDKHSLESKYYLPALKAVKDAVGDDMVVQLTSEAAGVYQAEQQMQLMQELVPDCMSLALREFIRTEKNLPDFISFVETLSAAKCLIQYILYDEADYQLYKKLIKEKQIPSDNHSLLLVLGRYIAETPNAAIVEQFQDILITDENWMCCTFGPNGNEILRKVVKLSCHVRVGFENGFYLPDGSIAKSNADLVTQTCLSFEESNRPLATIEETRKLLGQSG